MTALELFILLTAVVALGLFTYMIWSAVRGTREARHPQRRELHTTYGAGYGLLGWQEEWEWVVPPGVRPWRMTASIQKITDAMGLINQASMKGSEAFARIHKAMQAMEKARSQRGTIGR